jgi:endonuclease/exonuclease/phosphatase family metal-dependent hydrolase
VSDLVVATYNVHRCAGRDGRVAPQRVFAVGRELGADVLALQELDWNPQEAMHRLAAFADDLDCTALAGPTLLRADGHYGNAVLTRLEVAGVDRIDLSVPGREPRGAIDVELRAGGVPLRVIATHLGLNPEERRSQIARLRERLDLPPRRPTILLGDLNEWFLWGRPLRWLRRHFGRSPAPATFPARWPLFALDRIWVQPRECLTSLRVHDTPLAREASDHLPLRAEVRVRAGGWTRRAAPAARPP